MRKPLPRLICFVSALTGFIAFSGCSSPTPQPIPTGQKVARTPEELRVVRQPLEKLRAGNPGHELLSVPGIGDAMVSIFLTQDEAAALKTADRSQVFEVRYWYHEADYRSGSLGFGDVIGEADLESVRDGKTVIIDRTLCRLHHQTMTRGLARISYGLPMRQFVEALYHDFPHAAVKLGGCVIDYNSPQETPAYLCPVCDAAYQAWKPTFENQRAP
jgi:hypothetical protein